MNDKLRPITAVLLIAITAGTLFRLWWGVSVVAPEQIALSVLSIAVFIAMLPLLNERVAAQVAQVPRVARRLSRRLTRVSSRHSTIVVPEECVEPTPAAEPTCAYDPHEYPSEDRVSPRSPWCE